MTTTTVPTSEHAAAAPGGYQEQIDVLARRLEHGWRLIDQRLQVGEDVAELERHWLRLLGEYEQLCALVT